VTLGDLLETYYSLLLETYLSEALLDTLMEGRFVSPPRETIKAKLSYAKLTCGTLAARRSLPNES